MQTSINQQIAAIRTAKRNLHLNASTLDALNDAMATLAAYKTQLEGADEKRMNTVNELVAETLPEQYD